MATLQDEVTAAFQEIGVLAEGEVPNAAQGADALATTNRMLDQWAAEGMQFLVWTRTTWVIAASTQDYTVGLTQTVNASRPVSAEYIHHVTYYDSAVTPIVETPLTPLPDPEWASFPMKTQTGTLPAWWRYSPTYPSGTLSLFPIPTTSGLRGVLYAPTQTPAFTALSDSFAFPPGYAECLMTNLAVRLCRPYGVALTPELREAAAEAKALVKRSVKVPQALSFPADSLIGNGGGVWDITTGTYR